MLDQIAPFNNSDPSEAFGCQKLPGNFFLAVIGGAREPERRGFLADLVGSNQFGGLCMSAAPLVDSNMNPYLK